MYKIFAGLLLLVLGMWSCGESITIGSEILDEDLINLDYQDTFSLVGTPLKGDTIKYSPATNYSRYFIGNVDDAYFGSYEAKANFAFKASSTSFKGFIGATLDSVVLRLEYDTTNVVGDTLPAVSFLVRELEEEFLEIDSAYTNFQPALGDVIAEQVSFAYPSKKMKIFDTDVDSIVTSDAHLRIKLGDDFAQKLFNDTITLKNDTLIQNVYKGLSLSLGEDADRMLAFKRSTNNGLYMYYTDSEGDKKLYRFYLRSKIIPVFSQDLTNSKLESYIGDSIKGGELLFVQGLEGVDSRLMLPDLSYLKNKLINYAYIEAIVAEDLDGQSNPRHFPSLSQMLITSTNEEGSSIFIDDVTKYTNLVDGLNNHNGRVKVDKDGNKYVRFVVTDYVRSIVDGVANRECFIKPYSRVETSRSSVLYGPQHPTHPMKLKIAFTE